MYWAAIARAEGLSDEEQTVSQTTLFERACELNPFIAEPHVYLSQLAYRNADFKEARSQATSALQKFYANGFAWDKRMTFQAWVAHSRMLLLRANRRASCSSSYSLPVRDRSNTSGALPIVMIDDLVEAFEAQ